MVHCVRKNMANILRKYESEHRENLKSNHSKTEADNKPSLIIATA